MALSTLSCSISLRLDSASSNNEPPGSPLLHWRKSADLTIMGSLAMGAFGGKTPGKLKIGLGGSYLNWIRGRCGWLLQFSPWPCGVYTWICGLGLGTGYLYACEGLVNLKKAVCMLHHISVKWVSVVHMNRENVSPVTSQTAVWGYQSESNEGTVDDVLSKKSFLMHQSKHMSPFKTEFRRNQLLLNNNKHYTMRQNLKYIPLCVSFFTL